ncbi:hypothetical protein NI389_12240 [Pseudoalteromonas xiamenensis]|uniref:hypothetical protein n=1 Tax=Pseudoalteromonas xiamenensis TaxID=882626 RepID=UPI0027E3E0D0|nr:hypothetical protein [Pseudoalteromonas xiamenensis]WMN58984.1 hypothetical protein NI389_12240 [Pseudoalteromonas xiamenensis]
MTAIRNVNIGGDAHGAIINTGDNNTVSANINVEVPNADTVDIQLAFTELKDALQALHIQKPTKLHNAIAEAEEELGQPQPDKSEVGESLARAAKYVKEAENFTNHCDKLIERFTPVIGWLGPHAQRITEALGIAL